jgi:hypothetical protein
MTTVWTAVKDYSNTNIIDFTEGAYIDTTYTEGEIENNSFFIAQPPFDGFTIEVKGVPVESSNKKCAILYGDFELPDASTAQQLQCEYVKDGITLKAIGTYGRWYVQAPIYKVKDKTAYISDTIAKVSDTIYLSTADGRTHEIKIQNGLIVSHQAR